MAVNFYLDKRTDKKGDAPIRVSITIKGVRYLTSTGFKITPSKWDYDRQQARKGSSNATGMTWAVINSALARITEHFTKYENDCIFNDVSPDIDALKSEYARVFGRKRRTATKSDEPVMLGFWDYYEMFIHETSLANQWTVSTHQKFAALKKHIQSWRPDVTFDDFDENGFNSFIKHLIEKNQMKNTTIANQLGFVKWFLRWATLKGFNLNTTYQTFSQKLKTAQKQVVFLEWGELMKVFHYIVPRNGEEITLHDANGNAYTKVVHDAAAIAKTRDIFCFCCFTSLRYSDASNLKRANIKNDTLTITTIKTADTITIELNKYARAILDRYAADDLNGFALPPITNQRMNIYLKELCELCEINQLITHTYYRGAERIEETMPKYELIGTHTGRRTFICNALMLGIPAEIVMKWTGHSDYKSMKPYIDIANSAKAKAMALFDNLE
ncbi:MAG: site-specific integrase [Muribaculaceae bacterium]|nr:site-specific integrase [Muribaculaceae bacterium]